jgi:hypothetical protein
MRHVPRGLHLLPFLPGMRRRTRIDDPAGIQHVLFRHRTGHCAAPSASTALIAAALVIPALFPNSACAQGFFEALFGRRWTAPYAYADPNAQTPEAARPEPGGSVVFCVRLCDGRHFPMQRHAKVTAAQACSAFCPASRTRIYHGSSIEHAVGPDGKRYAELSSAFVYREQIVPDCTCNGKDPLGVVTTPLQEDATLHPGDIVATPTGLMAYSGGNQRQSSSFTPIESYAGVSEELRQRLTSTKVSPETAAPVIVTPKVTAEDKSAERPRRNQGNKRVQVER